MASLIILGASVAAIVSILVAMGSSPRTSQPLVDSAMSGLKFWAETYPQLRPPLESSTEQKRRLKIEQEQYEIHTGPYSYP